jgi:hypothetical protein
MELRFFKDFDFANFWSECSYSSKDYIEDFPNDEIITAIESELGYQLPGSYIELMRLQNGGLVNKSCFSTTESVSWAEDHVAITGIMGIGKMKIHSVCGEQGSKFMVNEWGYPSDGIYICDCPSAGHDMILLDYSSCGKSGEPEVVHVDQENDYKKTLLAKDFETFIRGLRQEEESE